jgi:hypothetical protein
MPLTITDCVVARQNENIITNPTSAELFDQYQPGMHIIVTGGTVAKALVNNAAYKITGKIAGDSRTYLGYVCKSTTSPYRFNKP